MVNPDVALHLATTLTDAWEATMPSTRVETERKARQAHRRKVITTVGYLQDVQEKVNRCEGGCETIGT